MKDFIKDLEKAILDNEQLEVFISSLGNSKEKEVSLKKLGRIHKLMLDVKNKIEDMDYE